MRHRSLNCGDILRHIVHARIITRSRYALLCLRCAYVAQRDVIIRAADAMTIRGACDANIPRALRHDSAREHDRRCGAVTAMPRC